MFQLMTGSDAVIPSPVFVDADGVTPKAADATPTLVVTRGDGTAVPTGAVAAAGTGIYSATIAAAELASPDRLTAVWTAAVDAAVRVLTQEIDVVGGVYVDTLTLWNLPDMPTSKMTPADVAAIRQEFEDIAERWTGQAWVPRYAREVHPYIVPPLAGLRTTNQILLENRLPRAIVGAVDDLDAVVITTGWLLEPSGLVTEVNLTSDTTIRYLHGADAPPSSLVEACKDYVRSKALERFGGNRIGRDVLSVSDGSGASTRYSTPDWAAGRPTGLLDVDRVLLSLGAPLPGVA